MRMSPLDPFRPHGEGGLSKRESARCIAPSSSLNGKAQAGSPSISGPQHFGGS